MLQARRLLTGRDFTARFAHVWTMQGGRIIRLQQCADTVQVVVHWLGSNPPNQLRIEEFYEIEVTALRDSVASCVIRGQIFFFNEITAHLRRLK